MKRILVDTNIVIDLLAKRNEFYPAAAELFSKADKEQLVITVSALTFANTNYILSRLTSPKEARSVLRKLKVLVMVLPLNDKITELALSDNAFPDFEDGLQYYSAIENKIDTIITRNKKDYRKAKITILTAREFLASQA